MSVTEQGLLAALSSVLDPHTGKDFVSTRALRNVQISGGDVAFDVELGYPAKSLVPELRRSLVAAAKGVAGVSNVSVNITTKVIAHAVQRGVQLLPQVKNIIAVASGKGGVGKSTTAANLALALAAEGASVGVLDADIYGPSQPTMLGVADLKPEQRDGKFIPVVSESGIQTMSIGFMIDTDQAVVWRGPMVSQALQQLLFQSQWDDVDYLFIDLPPGTGDIQLTLSQKIPVTASVIVTTPQDIALLDARKAVDMFAKVNIPILGIVENMAMHVCSNCGHAEAIFGSDGGKALADKLNVPLLAQLPLSLPIRVAMDAGQGAALHSKETAIADLYQQAAWQVALKVADMGRDFSSRFPKIVVE